MSAPGGAQSGDDQRVLLREFALVEQAADFALHAAVAMEDLTVTGRPKSGRRDGFHAMASCLRARARTRSASKSTKRVERGIEALDLADVRFGQFNDGDLAGAQQFSCRTAGSNTS